MDFRLRVFAAVAQYLSFTRAAKELFISQPAVTKHIQELESMYRVQLFERDGRKIMLTPAGHIFLKSANEIIAKYETLSDEMQLLSSQFSGEIRIGASTTIAQYLIAPLLADFIQRFPNVKVTLLNGNSEEVVKALEEKRIDIGLVEGNKREPNIKYTTLAKDELVMVTSAGNPEPDSIMAKDIIDKPLVLREIGSGTLDAIESALAQHGIKLSKLNILLNIGTTEGIKNFLNTMQNSYAIVSIISVLKELKNNELKVIDIKDMEMEREFAFVTMQGTVNERIENLISFSKLWYSKKYINNNKL